MVEFYFDLPLPTQLVPYIGISSRPRAVKSVYSRHPGNAVDITYHQIGADLMRSGRDTSDIGDIGDELGRSCSQGCQYLFNK
ncbi:hypothetical protein FRC03_011885, partial [Tulasnella sp. 419]